VTCLVRNQTEQVQGVRVRRIGLQHLAAQRLGLGQVTRLMVLSRQVNQFRGCRHSHLDYRRRHVSARSNREATGVRDATGVSSCFEN
jgi:hypothetical protein